MTPSGWELVYDQTVVSNVVSETAIYSNFKVYTFIT